MMMKRTMIYLLAFILLASGAGLYPAQAGEAEVIEGYLLELSPADEGAAASLLIEDYRGALYRLAVPAPAPFSIDGRPVGWDDMRPGLEVITRAQGSELLSLEAFSTPHPGYIAPESLIVKGLVTAINRDEITVWSDTGVEGRYTVAPFTIAAKGGVVVPVSALYSGDRVILHFDDIDSGLVSRIEIQDNSILVSQLYRATLQAVNPLEGRLSCSQLEAFRNGQWQPAPSAMTLAYDENLPVYSGGRPIMVSNLKYYRGKTVYLLSKQVMGREVVDRLLVKGSTEYIYQGCVDHVNYFGAQFELNRKNFTMDEGTLVIKDGRVQDISMISDGSSALVIADNWLGQSRSNIVYILDQGLNNSNLGQQQLYFGRIDFITNDSLWLRKPKQLQNHVFAGAGDKVQLYYGSDSKIYDSETGKWLQPAEFLAASYAVDEDSPYSEDYDLHDWYGYVYCDQDHILAMTLWPEKSDPEALRVSTGSLGTVVQDALIGWTVTLGNGYDWSHHNRQWMLKGTDLRLCAEDALIIKNGQAITPAELKAGDRLYLLRDDFYIRCAVVK